MQNNFKLILLSIVLLTSCKKEVTVDYEYHAHIISPTSVEKKVGDSLPIQVDFESHAGLTVHHVNVKIYEKTSKLEIYNKPTDAHVHASSGEHSHTGEVILTTAGTYVVEAKVWGENDGESEVTETVEFVVK